MVQLVITPSLAIYRNQELAWREQSSTYRARSLAVEHQTHNLTDPSSNLGRPTIFIKGTSI